MTVSGIPISRAAAEVGGAREVRRPNVKALREALQAGDIDAAKEAFAKIYKNVKHAPTDAAHDGIASNIKSLVQAVDAGDISAAKESLNSIRVDRQNTVYTPGQLPAGVAGQTGRDFRDLVRAIRSGDATVAKAELNDIRDGLRTHFSAPEAPFRIQPVSRPEATIEPARIQPMPQPYTTQPVSERAIIHPMDTQE